MICACLVGFVPVPSLHPLNIHGMFFCSLVLYGSEITAYQVIKLELVPRQKKVYCGHDIIEVAAVLPVVVDLPN